MTHSLEQESPFFWSAQKKSAAITRLAMAADF